MVGSADAEDRLGYRFYGNFFLALYYDSIGKVDRLWLRNLSRLCVGEQDMAQTFLAFPCTSKRYPPTDMWYHVPRALAKLRGWDFLVEDCPE